jgi:hypothetical protein
MRLAPNTPAARRTAAAAASLLAAAAATAAPRRAAAQDYRLASGVALSAGVADFDLTGSGTTAMVALRADAELRRWLVGEIGVGALRPKEARPSRLTYVVPEAQLQLQIRAGALRPYLGGGGGWFYAIGPNRKLQSALSASAAGGVRIAQPGHRYGLQAEVRLRGIDREFSREVTEWTAGAAFRF